MKRIFAIPILIFIAFIASIYFIAPKFSEVLKLREGVAKKQDRVDKTAKYFIQLQTFNKQLEDYKDTLDKINTALPAKISLPSLFFLVHDKVSSSGLLLNNVVPAASSQVPQQAVPGAEAPKTNTSAIKENYINVGVTGSFISCRDFVEALEMSSRFIEIEKVSFSVKKDKGLEMGIIAKAYSY